MDLLTLQVQVQVNNNVNRRWVGTWSLGEAKGTWLDTGHMERMDRWTDGMVNDLPFNPLTGRSMSDWSLEMETRCF